MSDVSRDQCLVPTVAPENRHYFKALTVSDGGSAKRPFHATLSRRKERVMLAISAGKRPIEIAEEMDVSVKTIST